MTQVAFIDASCIIHLHKGGVLKEIHHLTFRFVVPESIRSEVLAGENIDSEYFEQCGMELVSLTDDQAASAAELTQRQGGLSVSDCILVVVAQCSYGSIILTADTRLYKFAKSHGICVHGSLWVVRQLHSQNVCDVETLTKVLKIWKSDKLVYIPDDLIDQTLRDLQSQLLEPLIK